MSSKHRQPTGNAPAGRAGSPTPEYFIDLTVDSPLQHRSQTHRRPSVLRLSQNAESSQTPTVNIIDTDADQVLDRLLPPKKRARKDKNVEIESIINLSQAPQVNDTVSGESSVLSCPICLDDLSSKRKPTSTRCGHIYCAECIEKTLTTSKKCPKCQSNITRKSCIRIYF